MGAIKGVNMNTQIMVRLRGHDTKLKTRLEAAAKKQRRSLNEMAIIILEKGLADIDNST